MIGDADDLAGRIGDPQVGAGHRLTDNEVKDRSNRRNAWLRFLTGLGVVVVITAVVVGITVIWTDYIAQGEAVKREREVTRREHIEACSRIEDRALMTLCINGSLPSETTSEDDGG